TSPAHNNSLASGGGLVLVENFVTLIRLVQWDGAQVVNPRPIAKPKRWLQPRDKLQSNDEVHSNNTTCNTIYNLQSK
ncbi:MAG: hypothetical protein ACK5PC_06190, partial [Cyclobacteriaceae bacterium]